MLSIQKHFEEGWWHKLSPFLTSNEFNKITELLLRDRKNGNIITPHFSDMFRAFKECPYKDLKVVFLGLDPYPGGNRRPDGTYNFVADGIAFSAKNHELDKPASLRYVLSAMEKDAYGGFGIGYNPDYDNSDLTRWANQGVLLINCALSTRFGLTGQHMEIWTPFLRYIFKTLKENNTGIIYVLVGSVARMWKAAIDTEKNYVFTLTHPSYANRQGLDVWDCENIFSKTNDLLKKMNGESSKILW